MELSILIPVFHGEKVFKECISILYRSCSEVLGVKWEIIAVNNGFDEKEWKKLKEKYPKVRFHGNGENSGFAKGNNYALSKSKGKYVLLLNQDVFIKKSMIGELLKFLKDNSQYGVVAPQLHYTNNKPQHSCRPFPKFWMLVFDFISRGKYYSRYYSPLKSQEVEQPMASCLLWKGSVLRKLEGFDDHPHFFLYFNDVDLSYRFFKDGGKSYFLSSVSVPHLHGESAYGLPEVKRLNLWLKGLGRFWYKSGDLKIFAYFKAAVVAMALGLAGIFRRKREK